MACAASCRITFASAGSIRSALFCGLESVASAERARRHAYGRELVLGREHAVERAERIRRRGNRGRKTPWHGIHHRLLCGGGVGIRIMRGPWHFLCAIGFCAMLESSTMKMPKLLILFAGLLVCAAAISAQQTVAAPKPALTDDAAADATLAEDTNAPGTAATSPTDTAPDLDAAKKGVHRDAVVLFGRDVELKAGDSAEAVV